MTKIYEKEINNTEKFALLNILKAIESLSASQSGDNTAAETEKPQAKSSPPPKTAQETAAETRAPSGMAESILERHERIANRIYRGNR